MQRQSWNKKGFGLLEVLLAIAVAAVITIVGINYFANVRQEQHLNQFINQIRSIQQGIANYVASHPGSSLPFNNINGNENNFLLQNHIVQAEDITNAWNASQQYTVGVQVGASNSWSIACLQVKVQGNVTMRPTDCQLLQTRLASIFQIGERGNIFLSCTPGINHTLALFFCAQ